MTNVGKTATSAGAVLVEVFQRERPDLSASRTAPPYDGFYTSMLYRRVRVQVSSLGPANPAQRCLHAVKHETKM